MKFVKKLDKVSQRRIRNAILDIVEDTYFTSNVKKLSGHEMFRKRVGDFRIVYTVNDSMLLISVIDIKSRGDIYKRL